MNVYLRLALQPAAELRRHSLGFVFQQFNLIPTLAASENVEVARAPSDVPGRERGQRVGSLLDLVGLGHRAHHLPSKLFGGEQQRVAIARARKCAEASSRRPCHRARVMIVTVNPRFSPHGSVTTHMT